MQTGSPHLDGLDLLGNVGTHLTVDGYPASLVQGPPNAGCAALGGKQSITGTFLFHEVITMRGRLVRSDARAAAEAGTASRVTKVTAAAKATPDT